MARSRFPTALFVLLIFLSIIAVAAIKFEFFRPDVSITPDFSVLGREKTVTITAGDTLSGLKQIEVSLLQGNKRVEVTKRLFLKEGLLMRGRTKGHSLPITLRPLESGLADGQAILSISVRDYSWWGWFSGNNRVLEKNILIDTHPPDLFVLSSAHNINVGGTGLIVYQTESNSPVSGVFVGQKFYRGYPKKNGPQGVYTAYFALAWDSPKDVTLSLAAQDQAGNTARIPFPHRIKYRKLKTDKITLSKGFLETKMPELMQRCPELKGSHEEVFQQVNHKLRIENDRKLVEMCSRSEPTPQWKGAFLRMQGAAPMGFFADQRIYEYKGRELDRAVHLGIDLASTEHAPIQAANTGIVIYTGYLGIYGNSVIIDHGQGIFSMYGHLSTVTVKPGQMLEKGSPLGYSGSTGLAGGDHLHFSMIVGGTFVDPMEWWDSHWIQDNITLKLS